MPSSKPNSYTGELPAKGPPMRPLPTSWTVTSFTPQRVVRGLGYWLAPALTATHHYRHRLLLAQAAFSFIKRLSSPGAGVRPFLCPRIAQGLLLPIPTYGANLYTPNPCALRGMNSFWHRVQRWTTNTFFSIPTSILSREAYLPPIVSYCRYRRRLAALRVACAPPTNNPASVRLPASFVSLSAFRAQDSSPHLTRGLSLIYLPLDWRTPIPSPPLRKHLPIDSLAHLTFPLQEGLTRFPLVLHAPLPAGSNIPPAQLITNTYHTLRTRAMDRLLKDWASNAPAPPYYSHPPRLSPHPFMGQGKFVAGRVHQMRSAKSYLAAHPSWSDENPVLTCPRCRTDQETFRHAIHHCPARSRAQDLLLKEIDSVDTDSPIWTKPLPVKALGQYITSTRTGFPPEMNISFPPHPPPARSPPPPLES